MREFTRDILQELIKLFETAGRMGKEKDEPEGSRYIQISDTLANVLAEELHKYLNLKLRSPHNEIE